MEIQRLQQKVEKLENGLQNDSTVPSGKLEGMFFQDFAQLW